jgi:ubiquinone/menaquinone biosynthesis C-methylase UbiE
MPLIPATYIARQLRQPSGLVGGIFLPRLFNWRNAALNDFTLDTLSLAPADSVLEVGFGGGYLLGRVAAVSTHGAIAGVDASPAMVQYCRRRHRKLMRSGRLSLACASAEALPWRSETFTRACTVNTLFYVADPAQAIAELWRVLSGAGKAVVCFTLRQSLQDREFANHGLTLFDAGDVERLLLQAGFEDVHTLTAADRYRQFACVSGVKHTQHATRST